MTLQERIQAALNLIAADVTSLQTTRGNLAALNTAAKNSLVAALNELKAALDSVVANGAGIDDNATGTSSTWSAAKIISRVNEAIAGLVGSAPAALDTIYEIAAALNDSTSGLGALLNAVGNKVDYANAQSLTPAQQAQACANIGVGNPDSDLAAYYTAAKMP